MGLVSSPPPAQPDTRPVADTVSKLAQPLQVLVAGPEVPIESLLGDLSLPSAYLAILQPILEPKGYGLQQAELEDDSGEKHLYTLVRKGRERRCLICIPDVVLANPSRANIPVVYSIVSMFAGQQLYIFHENNPHVAYKYFLSGKWQERLDIQIRLNPLSDLRDLKDLEPERRSYSLLVMLDLTLRRKPADDISHKELTALTAVLASFPSFRDGDGEARRAFVTSAGIRQVLADFDFNGPPRTVAQGLVARLMEFGVSGEAGGRHVLGLLCEMLAGLPDLPLADRELVERLMAAYDFLG